MLSRPQAALSCQNAMWARPNARDDRSPATTPEDRKNEGTPRSHHPVRASPSCLLEPQSRGSARAGRAVDGQSASRLAWPSWRQSESYIPAPVDAAPCFLPVLRCRAYATPRPARGGARAAACKASVMSMALTPGRTTARKVMRPEQDGQAKSPTTRCRRPRECPNPCRGGCHPLRR